MSFFINYRIIPCLLLSNAGLVKTIKFKNPNYIGDPINAVKIYNEKEVDELIFLDIDSSKLNSEPNYELISKIASECFMPFAYGGGVSKLEQIQKLLRIGVEKVIINSAGAENPEFLKAATTQFGSSTIIAAIDIKKNSLTKRYSIYTNSGTKYIKKNIFDYVNELEDLGIGELFVNSIDRDGCMQGYDLDIIKQIAAHVNVPIIACGGAGSLEHIKELIRSTKVSAAAGSLFIYHGKIKGILINYPSRNELDHISMS